MSEDEFTKLYRHTTKMVNDLRKDMEHGFEMMHAEFNRIYGLFDSANGEIKSLDYEQLMMKRQADRHERWIGELSEKTKPS